MSDEVMFGSIYKITNKINNKVYIGQTVQPLNYRWTGHCSNANMGIDTHFCRAIRKYGKDNFIIEEIEKVSIDQLDDVEIKWIAYYDSYNNGYNSTLGGGGNKGCDLDESEVIDHYLKCKNAYITAEFFGCSISPIYSILRKNGIKNKDLDHDEVIKYYLDCRSTFKTAEFFGVNDETIRKILVKNDIKRDGHTRYDLDEEEIINYYLECKSIEDTVKHFGHYHEAISKILNNNNIERLRKTRSRFIWDENGNKKYLNEEEVINYYLDCRLIYKTAEYFKCCLKAVSDILNNNNVDRSEDSISVYAIDKNGNRYDFDDIKDAVDYLIKNGNSKIISRPKENAYKQAINKTARGEKKTAYGLKWYYKENNEDTLLENVI